MRTSAYELQDILNAFQRKRILTKSEIREATGCSTVTVWRLLRQIGYLTSYNENARYYTIAGVPKFNQDGLWSYGHVRFSKWGTLTRTIVGLIQASSAGLDARQLQELLQIKNVKPSLTRLVQNQLLTRHEVEGRFVYFPLQQTKRRKQQKQRQQQTEKARATRSLPPLEQIIALLVEIIKRPEDTARQWARRLAQQGMPLRTAEIQLVLDHYQIDAKKNA